MLTSALHGDYAVAGVPWDTAVTELSPTQKEHLSFVDKELVVLLDTPTPDRTEVAILAGTVIDQRTGSMRDEFISVEDQRAFVDGLATTARAALVSFLTPHNRPKGATSSESSAWKVGKAARSLRGIASCIALRRDIASRLAQARDDAEASEAAAAAVAAAEPNVDDVVEVGDVELVEDDEFFAPLGFASDDISQWDDSDDNATNGKYIIPPPSRVDTSAGGLYRLARKWA